MALKRGPYEELVAKFSWAIPEQFNIAEAICDRHVGQRRIALIHEEVNGRVSELSFEDLQDRSKRLANALEAHGVARGDRVGILLPQCPEVAIAHLACYRIGAIALPLFTLFGPEALEYRLNDSGAKAVIVNDEGVAKLDALRQSLKAPVILVNVDGARGDGVLGFADLLERASAQRTLGPTSSEDPAIIVYTSGTTGNPKGVLYPHRILLGHLPGVELPHEFFPQPGDRMWTPADWAWAGGLLDVLLPSLYHGIPVVAKRFAKFEPDAAFDLMARHGVRNAFMPPTALKMMRQVAEPKKRYKLELRSIGSGGERLGDEVLSWGRDVFGLTINEFYGQTEANLTIANCASIMPTKEGSMGRAVPGHKVEIVNEEGRPVPPGDTGNIAVLAPDPVFFLKYWNKPEATRDKFRGPWLMTGDTGHRDEEGYFWFHGRDDDVILSGGYRIGPSEIEDCIMRHPAVAMVAVIGVPHPVRGEAVKAFVVPRDMATADDELVRALQTLVKSKLSAHEYPREIEFRAALPMTVTGKIMRRNLREESK